MVTISGAHRSAADAASSASGDGRKTRHSQKVWVWLSDVVHEVGRRDPAESDEALARRHGSGWGMAGRGDNSVQGRAVDGRGLCNQQGSPPVLGYPANEPVFRSLASRSVRYNATRGHSDHMAPRNGQGLAGGPDGIGLVGLAATAACLLRPVGLDDHVPGGGQRAGQASARPRPGCRTPRRQPRRTRPSARLQFTKYVQPRPVGPTAHAEVRGRTRTRCLTHFGRPRVP